MIATACGRRNAPPRRPASIFRDAPASDQTARGEQLLAKHRGCTRASGGADLPESSFRDTQAA